MKEIEPGQEWQVDFMRPEEAPQVVELFKLVYGEGYPIRTFTDPEELVRQNREGSTISSVARTPKGEIVGHNALYRVAPYPGVYESGAGLVHPAYRGGQGIFFEMGMHGLSGGPHLSKLEVVMVEPVCNYPYAQKAVSRAGFIFTAIEVDLMPAAAYTQEKSASGRVTTLMGFLVRKDKPHRVYLPARHRAALEFCYTDLGAEREFADGSAPLPSGPGSRLSTQHFDFAQVARVALEEGAQDLGAVMAAEEEALRAKGVLMIEVWLPLSWPWSGAAAEILGQQGYFWGGLLPCWLDQDALLLQKTVNEPGWDQISIASERAQKILDQAQADWRRVSQKKH